MHHPEPADARPAYDLPSIRLCAVRLLGYFRVTVTAPSAVLVQDHALSNVNGVPLQPWSGPEDSRKLMTRT